MGRVVGFEPTRNGATIRRVNRFTIPATEKRKKFKPKFFALQKRLYHDTPPLSIRPRCVYYIDYAADAACGFRHLSHGGLPRRTPVVFHSLSSPWKKENETRERRRRQIEIFLRSGALGCSALPMLTSKEARSFYFHKRYLPRKAARRIRPPLHLPCLQGPASENFKQAGPLAPDLAAQ